MARRRRYVHMRSPVSTARLEPVTWCLFDSLAVTDTTAGDQRFFQDQVGQNGKTTLLTNMEKPSALATPKLFDIRLCYLLLNQSLATFTAAITDAIPNDAPAEQNALLGLMYSTFFTLRVGEKDYIQHPTFLLSGNYKVNGGVVGGDIPVASETRTIFAQMVGMPFSVARRRIRLLPDQTFRGTLTFPITGAGVPASGRVLHCGLDGILFREMQ